MLCPKAPTRKRERTYEMEHSVVVMPRRAIHGESIRRIGRNAGPWCAVLALFCASLAAQQPGTQNPYTSVDDEAAGARLFRPLCAICHGLDGNGTIGIGPQIRRGSPGRSTDAELYETIRDGIPGTGMAPFTFSEKERWQVVAYVRSLRRTAGAEESAGDAARGAKLFRGRGGCSQCHTVKGEGGAPRSRSEPHWRGQIYRGTEAIHPQPERDGFSRLLGAARYHPRRGHGHRQAVKRRHFLAAAPRFPGAPYLSHQERPRRI